MPLLACVNVCVMSMRKSVTLVKDSLYILFVLNGRLIPDCCCCCCLNPIAYCDNFKDEPS